VQVPRYAEKEGGLDDIASKYQQPKLISEHLTRAASTRHVRLDPVQARFLRQRQINEQEATELDRSLRASGLTGMTCARADAAGMTRAQYRGQANPDFRMSITPRAIYSATVASRRARTKWTIRRRLRQKHEWTPKRHPTLGNAGSGAAAPQGRRG
jgi:hypothetical protein